MTATPFIDILCDDSAEPGILQRQLGEAVSVWAWMQQGDEPQTIATTALTFNTTPELVRSALDEHPWASWIGPYDDPTKQLIEHDGE